MDKNKLCWSVMVCCLVGCVTPLPRHPSQAPQTPMIVEETIGESPAPMPPLASLATIFPHPNARREVITAMATAPVMTRPVTLSWKFPTNQQTPDLIFKVRSSTNLLAPLATWPLRTNVPGTNRSVVLQTTFQQEFFTLTASNYLGESGYATK